MEFFADTASLEEIAYCFDRGINDGITTNPKIIEATGDLSLGFETACKNILEKYPKVPISLETDFRCTDVKRIHQIPDIVKNVLLQQAYVLASLADNVVIKIPCCEGGILATEKLKKEGIKTNFTACMTPYQALKATDAGATYVSLFANRMLDSHILELAGHSLEEISTKPNWKNIVKENKEEYFEKAWEKTLSQIRYVAEKLEGKKSKLIVGSIRDPEDIYRIVKAEPQVITIPTKIVKELKNIGGLKKTKRSFRQNNAGLGNSLYHPMTQHTLEEFEKCADSYRK